MVRLSETKPKPVLRQKINWHYLTCFAHNSLATDKLVDLGSLIEFEFWHVRDVGFCEGKKTGEPGVNPSEQGREPGNALVFLGKTPCSLWHWLLTLIIDSRFAYCQRSVCDGDISAMFCTGHSVWSDEINCLMQNTETKYFSEPSWNK